MTSSSIHVHLHLFPAANGGRSEPIAPGYRSLVRFEGSETDFGFELEPDSDAIRPGGSGAAGLRFWATADLPDLSRSRHFELREGTRVVGRGEVVETTALRPRGQRVPVPRS